MGETLERKILQVVSGCLLFSQQQRLGILSTLKGGKKNFNGKMRSLPYQEPILWLFCIFSVICGDFVATLCIYRHSLWLWAVVVAPPQCNSWEKYTHWCLGACLPACEAVFMQQGGWRAQQIDDTGAWADEACCVLVNRWWKRLTSAPSPNEPQLLPHRLIYSRFQSAGLIFTREGRRCVIVLKATLCLNLFNIFSIVISILIFHGNFLKFMSPPCARVLAN